MISVRQKLDPAVLGVADILAASEFQRLHSFLSEAPVLRAARQGCASSRSTKFKSQTRSGGDVVGGDCGVRALPHWLTWDDSARHRISLFRLFLTVRFPRN